MGGGVVYVSAWSPWVVKVTQTAAICYLLQLSFTLWQRKSTAVDPGTDRFSGLHFFWLTVMNPKGLLIVSFIAPISAFATLQGYARFMTTLALVVIPVGFAWILLGSRFEGGQRRGYAVEINLGNLDGHRCFATVLLGRLADSDFQLTRGSISDAGRNHFALASTQD